MTEGEKKQKVLVVVYDNLTERTVRRALNGMEVDGANSFEAAQNKIKNGTYDAVLTDWSQVNGEEIAKLAHNQGVKIIAILNGGHPTFTPDKQDELLGLGISVIPKPFKINQLINLVKGKIKGLIKTDEL